MAVTTQKRDHRTFTKQVADRMWVTQCMDKYKRVSGHNLSLEEWQSRKKEPVEQDPASHPSYFDNQHQHEWIAAKLEYMRDPFVIRRIGTQYQVVEGRKD